MILFWLSFALLSLTAIMFVVWPALRLKVTSDPVDRIATNVSVFNERMQEVEQEWKRGDISDADYQAQKIELEATLWDDVQVVDTEPAHARYRLWLLGLSLFIPAIALLLYGYLGSYREVALSKAIEQSVTASSPQAREQSYENVIARLLEITQANPNQADNWFLLGEFYMQMKQYALAADAFGHAVSIQSNDADAVAQYAQALYFAENNKLTFAVTSAVDQALKINPNQPTALGLAGITAFENKNYLKAIGYWQQILLLVGDQDPGSQSLRDGIAAAKELLQKEGKWPSLNVQVTIDPSVHITPEQWIFVYARLPGERKPVAIARLKAMDLPPTVVLDDTLRMPNGDTLSSAGKVEVVVRLSDTGAAQPAAGDKQVISGPILPSNQGTPVHLLLK